MNFVTRRAGELVEKGTCTPNAKKKKRKKKKKKKKKATHTPMQLEMKIYIYNMYIPNSLVYSLTGFAE